METKAITRAVEKNGNEGIIMEIIERVLDATEKKVFDLMFTKKEFEKWLAENNLEFNTENLKKYKDYCFNWVLENVWEI